MYFLQFKLPVSKFSISEGQERKLILLGKIYMLDFDSQSMKRGVAFKSGTSCLKPRLGNVVKIMKISISLNMTNVQVILVS